MPASPNEYQVNPASVSQVKTLAENLFLKHFTAYLENWLSSSLKPFHWAAPRCNEFSDLIHLTQLQCFNRHFEI
jgi:hypothetical protein